MEVELAANTAGLRGLTTRFSGSGRVEAIVFRPQRRAPAIYADEARIEPGRGLIGDHRAQRLSDTDERRKRELTLIQHEYLPLIAAWTSQGSVDALRLRRNLVLVWRLGPEICIEVTGTCPPCSRMEAELGVGGYNALRGHGGMTARVITGGVIRVGDAVHLERVDAARGSR